MSKLTAFAKFRPSSGMTLDAVAEIFNVDRKTILRWETGETPLPLKRMGEFERVTGFAPHELRPDLAIIFGPTTSRPSKLEKSA